MHLPLAYWMTYLRMDPTVVSSNHSCFVSCPRSRLCGGLRPALQTDSSKVTLRRIANSTPAATLEQKSSEANFGAEGQLRDLFSLPHH
jgi:hypothetical protein